MFGQRLRIARKRAGLSMRALAEQMTPRVTAQAISKYETGKMMPSSSVLLALSRALDVSLDFLMSSQVQTLDGLEFREHSKTSARDRARAEATLIDHLERYLAIEAILNLPVTVDRIGHHRCDSIANEAEIDSTADSIRSAWELGTGPISSFCELLEEESIKVIEADLPERVNGLACRVLRDGKPVADAVVVSNRINVERKRFTLAHELAHRIIRRTGNPAINLERAMNRFAGAFLIPARRLVSEVGASRRHVTYLEIVRLKHIYGVSAATMLVRLGQVGVLSPARVQRAFSTSARSWRRAEPAPIGANQGFATSESPSRFESLVLRALAEELISPARAATLLQQPLESVEYRIRGPKPN